MSKPGTKVDIKDLYAGSSLELLKALHILTREGNLNADSRRKLKQVHHLSQFIEPLIRTLQKVQSDDRPLHVVDMGAGKSYLGFILYDLVLKQIDSSLLTSIESRNELIERSKKLAESSGFNRMHFVASSIQDAQLDHPVDLVCALHACDTATDDAILFGIKHGARAFALVPCCQAEVARLLKNDDAKKSSMHSLFQHPIHQREFGSHLTNVIRALYLSSKGFKVTVSELVGWEHSMKNEIILAEKVSDETHPTSQKAKAELQALLTELNLLPFLIRN